jgi:WD40 repeat protein
MQLTCPYCYLSTKVLQNMNLARLGGQIPKTVGKKNRNGHPFRFSTGEPYMKLNLRGRVFDTTKDIPVINSTYFAQLILSLSFELDVNGEFFIDKNSHCFNRILEYMSTGELLTEGLNSYDKDCLYANLKYFMIPHKPRLDYSQISVIENLELEVFLQLKDGRLCGAAAWDPVIVVYNLDTNRIDMSLEGHTNAVNAVIQLEDGRLCSCSYDRTIKVWNIKSGQCELSIEEHTNDVNCVIQLLDGRLCTGSYDRTLKVWCKDSGACDLSVDTGECVRCVAQLRDGRVSTGDDAGDIKVWNLNTRLCEITLNEPGYSITAMVIIDESRICSCFGDSTIKVWNIDTGACERTLVGHQMCVNHIVLLLDGRVCSASDDGALKIWNTDTGVCDLSSHVCDDGLYRVLQLHDGRLLSSDYNEEVFIIGA